MKDTVFMQGTEEIPQQLYYPDDHPDYPSHFKGMSVLLCKRGFIKESMLRAECPGFHCRDSVGGSCCCRCFLFNQPDFSGEKSILERVGDDAGVRIVFLRKFHCKLNFIEQCWGAAKRNYRKYPRSSTEEDLVANVIAALDSIPILMMRR